MIDLDEKEFNDIVDRAVRELWKDAHKRTPTTERFPVYEDWCKFDPIGQDEYEAKVDRMMRRILGYNKPPKYPT